MDDQIRKVRAREKWLEIFKQTQCITTTALRCGIARSTLYRWKKRYDEAGREGLLDKSRRPHSLARQKVTDEIEQLILQLRKDRKWGAQRISNFLKRTRKINLSAMTVWRVMDSHGIPRLKKNRKRSDFKRYSRPVPGERVQMDVCKIRSGAYQFTAIDDCTRLKVIRIYPRKTARYSIEFLGEVLDDLGFPIQRIQTDWGTEFFNYSFQAELHEHFIKFRPIKPRSPHLNGKVERTQQTDKVEFWSCLNLQDRKLDLDKHCRKWQEYYNKKRPHSSLKGKTPWQRYKETLPLIPTQPEVTNAFWESNEIVKPRNSAFLRWKPVPR